MIKCLVVDQDEPERRAVSDLLSGYGFELAESATVIGALMHCRSASPDVVVLSDGIGSERRELIRKAQRRGRGKRPVFLVYTANPDPGAIGQAILDGAAECLVKPFDRELLEFKLRQVGLL